MLKRFTYSVISLLAISPALAEKNVNRIQIDAPPTFVYQYITQPDSWHDWYPYSKSAKTPGGSLVKGQTFSEVVRINQQDTDFSYRVVESKSPVLWRVEYSSAVVMGSIQYQLDETIDGTLLTRTLEYYQKPANPEEKVLLDKAETQVQKTSLRALLQLRENLETSWLKK